MNTDNNTAEKSFALLINADPGSAFSKAALHFAMQLANENTLLGIFFQGKGVLNLAQNTHTNQASNQAAWQNFLEKTSVNTHCCSAAVNEFSLSEKLAPHISISGLGELISLSASAQHLITFGDC